MEAIYVKYSDELYHHGVKEQKWGVRRYQNKDGSLTALGKKHVKGEDKGSETAAGAVGGGAAKDDKEKEKKTEGLSDKEVAKYSNDVVKGSYGNWQDRVNNLKKKGLSADDIIKVQGRVNESLGVSGGASKEFQALVRNSFKSSDSKPKTSAKKTAVKKTKVSVAKKTTSKSSDINTAVAGAVKKLKKEAKKEMKNKYVKHYDEGNVYIKYYDESDELYHHGVKGQRWGVRHYQNPDGSLTAAGQKRITKLQKGVAKWTKKQAKYEKKKYKAMKGISSHSKEKKLMKYSKKSAKALKKRAKIEKKLYKFQKMQLKTVKKYQRQKGRDAVNAALGMA